MMLLTSLRNRAKTYYGIIATQCVVILLSLSLCSYTALGLSDSARRGDWKLPANAAAHAGVTGLMSGFIAAIIVLFITSNDRRTESLQQDETKLSIAVFITAFFQCVLSSFLYATFAGIPVEESNPISALYQFVFSLNGIPYFLGIALTFSAITLVTMLIYSNTIIVEITEFLNKAIVMLGYFWLFQGFWLLEKKEWGLKIVICIPIIASLVSYASFASPSTNTKNPSGRMTISECKEQIRNYLISSLKISVCLCLLLTAVTGFLYSYPENNFNEGIEGKGPVGQFFICMPTSVLGLALGALLGKMEKCYDLVRSFNKLTHCDQ